MSPIRYMHGFLLPLIMISCQVLLAYNHQYDRYGYPMPVFYNEWPPYRYRHISNWQRSPARIRYPATTAYTRVNVDRSNQNVNPTRPIRVRVVQPKPAPCTIDTAKLNQIIKEAEEYVSQNKSAMSKTFITFKHSTSECESPSCLAQAQNGARPAVFKILQWQGFVQELVATKVKEFLGLNSAEFLSCLKRGRSPRASSSRRQSSVIRGSTKLNEILLTCPWLKPVSCTKHVKYRTADGKCNNLLNKHYGSAIIPMERLLEPQYDDGIEKLKTKSSGRGYGYRARLPNVRFISRTIHTASKEKHESRDLTHMNMLWGQFLDHDITLTPMQKGPDGKEIDCCNHFKKLGPKVCLNIKIPRNDPLKRRCMNFVRSAAAPKFECTIGPRQQINENTAWIDGSQLYGSSDEEEKKIRTKQDGSFSKRGRLSLSEGLHLPHAPDGHRGCIKPKPPADKGVFCVTSGDERALENTALTFMHTVFARWHNILAGRLQNINPHWTDETLFQETRRIVSTAFQIITYRDWLPNILGRKTMLRYGLRHYSRGHTYSVYDRNESPNIVNSFATASFRYGHSMMKDFLDNVTSNYADQTRRNFRDSFFQVIRLYEKDASSALLRGMCSRPTQNTDSHMADEMTNHLFEKKGKALDLASLNIQRGRDHGLPGYNAFRRYCKLRTLRSIGDLRRFRIMTPRVARKFRMVYRHVNDIDLWSAGISEIPLKGAQVGPTFACLLGEQFRKIKVSDRFWWNNARQQYPFTNAQLGSLRRITLSKILCRGLNVEGKVPYETTAYDVFLLPHLQGNKLIKCKDLDPLDLRPWKNQA